MQLGSAGEGLITPPGGIAFASARAATIDLSLGCGVMSADVLGSRNCIRRLASPHGCTPRTPMFEIDFLPVGAGEGSREVLHGPGEESLRAPRPELSILVVGCPCVPA